MVGLGLGRAFTTALGLGLDIDDEDAGGCEGGKENTPAASAATAHTAHTAPAVAAAQATKSPVKDRAGGPSAKKLVYSQAKKGGAKPVPGSVGSGRRLAGRAGALPLTSSFLASPATPTALNGLGAALSLSPLSPLPWPTSSSSSSSAAAGGAASPLPAGLHASAAAAAGLSPPAFSLSSVKKAARGGGLTRRAPHSRSRQRTATEDGVAHTAHGDGNDDAYGDDDGEEGAAGRWSGRGQFFADSDYLAVAPDGACSDREEEADEAGGRRGEMSVSRSALSTSPHHLSMPLPAGLSSTLQLFSPVKGGGGDDAAGAAGSAGKEEAPRSGVRSERKGSANKAKAKKTA